MKIGGKGRPRLISEERKKDLGMRNRCLCVIEENMRIKEYTIDGLLPLHLFRKKGKERVPRKGQGIFDGEKKIPFFSRAA